MNRTIKLLGTLGVGASLWYLLEPEEGIRRRKRMRKAMQKNLKRSRKTLHRYSKDVKGFTGEMGDMRRDVQKRAVSTATELGRELGAQAHRFASSGRELGDEAVERVEEYGEALSEQLRRGRDRLSSRGEKAAHQLMARGKKARKEALEPIIEGLEGSADRGREAVGEFFGALQNAANHLPDLRRPQRGRFWSMLTLGLGFGAAMVYFLAPESGANRRLRFQKRVSTAFEGAGGTVQDSLEALRARIDDLMVQVREQLGMEDRDQDQEGRRSELPDGALKAQVRAALHRTSADVHDVRIKVKHGHVRVTGRVPRGDVDAILACVASVPGVLEVINEVQRQENPRNMSSVPH